MQEKVLRKTHPDTLATIMNMAIVYKDGLKNFTKAEDMFTLTLNGYEKSLGKDHEYTMDCGRNLNVLLEKMERTEVKAALEENHPESGM